MCTKPNPLTNLLFGVQAELGRRYLNVLNLVEPGVGRNRAKTIVEVVQSELFLTSTDVRDGRLDPREAAIRVKGEATCLHFLSSS